MQPQRTRQATKTSREGPSQDWPMRAYAGQEEMDEMEEILAQLLPDGTQPSRKMEGSNGSEEDGQALNRRIKNPGAQSQEEVTGKPSLACKESQMQGKAGRNAGRKATAEKISHGGTDGKGANRWAIRPEDTASAHLGDVPKGPKTQVSSNKEHVQKMRGVAEPGHPIQNPQCAEVSVGNEGKKRPSPMHEEKPADAPQATPQMDGPKPRQPVEPTTMEEYAEALRNRHARINKLTNLPRDKSPRNIGN